MAAPVTVWASVRPRPRSPARPTCATARPRAAAPAAATPTAWRRTSAIRRPAAAATRSASARPARTTSECLTDNFCTNGVCCTTSACGVCQACNVGATAGNCANVAVGATDSRCTPSPPCGNTGACNGAGACQQAATTVSCGTQSCSGSTFTPVSRCNGTGACATPTTSSCSPFTCGTGACRTSCTVDSDCLAPFTCQGTAPKSCALKPNGQVCTAANQCISGNCVNGVCCGSADLRHLPDLHRHHAGHVHADRRRHAGAGGPVRRERALRQHRHLQRRQRLHAGRDHRPVRSGGVLHRNDVPAAVVLLRHAAPAPRPPSPPAATTSAPAPPRAAPTATRTRTARTRTSTAPATPPPRGPASPRRQPAWPAAAPTSAPAATASTASAAAAAACRDLPDLRRHHAGHLHARWPPARRRRRASAPRAAPCGNTGTCNGASACHAGSRPRSRAGRRLPAPASPINRRRSAAAAAPAARWARPAARRSSATRRDGCLTSCNNNDLECVSGNYCTGANGSCLAKKTPGTACGTGHECTTGNCVDGVCCNSGACGTCQTCNGDQPRDVHADRQRTGADRPVFADSALRQHGHLHQRRLHAGQRRPDVLRLRLQHGGELPARRHVQRQRQLFDPGRGDLPAVHLFGRLPLHVQQRHPLRQRLLLRRWQLRPQEGPRRHLRARRRVRIHPLHRRGRLLHHRHLRRLHDLQGDRDVPQRAAGRGRSAGNVRRSAVDLWNQGHLQRRRRLRQLPDSATECLTSCDGPCTSPTPTATCPGTCGTPPCSSFARR